MLEFVTLVFIYFLGQETWFILQIVNHTDIYYFIYFKQGTHLLHDKHQWKSCWDCQHGHLYRAIYSRINSIDQRHILSYYILGNFITNDVGGYFCVRACIVCIYVIRICWSWVMQVYTRKHKCIRKHTYSDLIHSLALIDIFDLFGAYMYISMFPNKNEWSSLT